MFKVDADTVKGCIAFDPAREIDLVLLDRLITGVAPSLTRYFHGGTAAGEPDMRFKTADPSNPWRRG